MTNLIEKQKMFLYKNTNLINNKNTNGITLIALVITIIVLLILAGVTIATLMGDNGILTKAQQAKTETEEAEEDELRKLTALEASTNLESHPYTDKNGDIATIPTGFAVSQVEGENIIDDGLVVIDSNGNEFVWVPVEITDEEKEAGITFETKYPRTEFLDNAPITGLNSNYTEPYINGYEGEDTEYQSMIESVTEHGGFYVGRYEAGCEKQRTEENKTTEQKVLVKKGAYVYNYVPWGNAMNDTGVTTGHETTYNGITGAVELSKNFATANNYNTTKVKSTLIYGIQWDMMLRYVANSEHNVNDSRNWGNFNNSIDDAVKNSGINNMNYTTGKSNAWKTKNIYDIAGNIWEWTMEAYGTNYRIRRGGSYNDDGAKYSAYYRNTSNPYASIDGFGFRIALYIN